MLERPERVVLAGDGRLGESAGIGERGVGIRTGGSVLFDICNRKLTNYCGKE